MPLYLVVLSLIGASVNMIRRIPEFQRPVNEGSNDKISREKDREHLLLLMMQVVSAPLFAIMFYYLISPNSRAVTVILGVSIGFASESILLTIRLLTILLGSLGTRIVVRQA